MRAHPGRLALLSCVASIVTACAGGTSSSAPGNATPQQRADQNAPRYLPRAGTYRFDPAKTRPLTRPERTNFRETSSYADVTAFLDSLKAMDLAFTQGIMGKSSAGRDIPYVVLSRPRVNTPSDARRLNRPIVYIQGNIHGGEVEGKEAVQSLMRDLLLDKEYNVLDSLVIIVVPIYNIDGNERLAPQAKNRTEQNGPEMIGERTTGNGLDLNRDYIKAEAPETKAFLRFVNAWNPDMFVDLHTTDGTFHGYAVTYSPPLNPASFGGAAFTRDTLLPELRRRLRTARKMETNDYGNVETREDSIRGWFTYDYRPRYGTNYMGVRGRNSVLVEAFSHDPFQARIASTYTFVYDLLSLIADAGAEVMDYSSEADRRAIGWGTLPTSSPKIPLRAGFAAPSRREGIPLEDLVSTGDSSLTQPGVPRGQRRTGRFRSVTLPVYDRFASLLSRTLPYAWAMPATPAVVEQLRLHGVIVERLDTPVEVELERFTVDTITRASREFQGHREVRLAGRWNRAPHQTLPAGTIVVRAGQPLSILAAQLLEPESADGLTSWNVFDPALNVGSDHPVVRVLQPLVGGLSREP